MTQLLTQPGTEAVDRQDPITGAVLEVTFNWRTFFVSVYNLLIGLTLSGMTANRPTKGLFTSRTYFDTTLGIPIWWDGTNWIDATGAIV